MANNKDKKILNVPALRFPEFTEEWKNTTLKNECSINPTSDKLKDEFVYVDLESVEKGELTKKQVIEKENAPSRAQRVLRNGDVLFQCVRPYQRNNYLVKNVSSEVQWVASTGYAQLRTERNNPAFIYHLLNTSSFNKKVIVRCTGSSYPAINSDDLSKIHFYICGDIEEQKRIADFLTLLDERIATQNKIIEKLETLIKGICNKSLYTVNGTAIQLGDILIERRERTVINNQYEVLSSTVKGIFSQREYFSKDIASENNVGYKIIRLHDVVLSPQNLWMGNVNYNDNFEVGIVSPSYKVFSIAENLDKRYIATLLKTHRALYNYMLVSEQGASIVRRNLNMEAFEQITFKIPPLSKQEKIGNAISILQARITSAIRIKTAYEAQKQWLLTQMFI